MTDKELKAIAGAALDVAKPRWRYLPANIKDALMADVLAAIAPMLRPTKEAEQDEAEQDEV